MGSKQSSSTSSLDLAQEFGVLSQAGKRQRIMSDDLTIRVSLTETHIASKNSSKKEKASKKAKKI